MDEIDHHNDIRRMMIEMATAEGITVDKKDQFEKALGGSDREHWHGYAKVALAELMRDWFREDRVEQEGYCWNDVAESVVIYADKMLAAEKERWES